MSLGLHYLRKAIDTGDAAAIRRARREWFIDEELAAFDAARAHVMQYREVPSLRAMRVAGIELPELRQNDDIRWFSDRLVSRSAYNAVNVLHPDLSAAMQGKDMARVEELLRQMATACARLRNRDSYSTLGDEAVRVMEDFTAAKRRTGLLGCPLRWDTLNEATLGAQGGDVIAVVGRPGLGKSWVMGELAHDNRVQGKRGAFVSMEMGLKQIVRRFMGRMTGINPNDIRKGELPDWAEQDLRSCVANFANSAPWHLMAGDMQGNVGGIEAMCDLFEPEILFVDAAYLLSPAARMANGVSKWETIGQVIKELKRLAINRDIPVVISVQFNRNQKKNSKREMDLSDIAGSDSIPQDCSVVIGMRPGPPPYQDDVREMVVLKNREGDAPKWFINFGFRPVNFEEIEGFDPGGDRQQPEQLAPDVSWMR